MCSGIIEPMKLPSLILSFLAYVLASAAHANAAPTTEPIASAKVVVAPPKVAYIPDGTDLAPLINTAKAGQVLECTPNATYPVKSTCGPASIGVTLHLNGSKLNLTASPGSSTNFSVHAAHFLVSGGTFVGGLVVFRDYADSLAVSNCEFQKCWTAVQTDIGGTNASVLACKIDGTSKVGIYIDQSGSLIDSCYLGPSDLEYSLRYEISSKNVKLDGAKLQNSTVYNPRNATNGSKDAIGIRVGDNVFLNNCTVTGDIRVGQAPKTPPWPNPATYCNGTVLTGITINGISDTMYALVCYQGCTVTTHWCSPYAMYAMTVGSNSILTSDNSTHWFPANTACKPLISVSSTGRHSEFETVNKEMPAK